MTFARNHFILYVTSINDCLAKDAKAQMFRRADGIGYDICKNL